MIHLGCGDFGEGTDEKCTSTLTARLKPVVARLAGVLLEEDNRNRAIFAHSRPGMAYTTKGEGDRYDPDQWVHVGVKDKHHKRRSAAKESE